MRRFLYKDWDITVVGNEYFITSRKRDTKELQHFETDEECMDYLDGRDR